MSLGCWRRSHLFGPPHQTSLPSFASLEFDTRKQCDVTILQTPFKLSTIDDPAQEF